MELNQSVWIYFTIILLTLRIGNSSSTITECISYIEIMLKALLHAHIEIGKNPAIELLHIFQELTL